MRPIGTCVRRDEDIDGPIAGTPSFVEVTQRALEQIRTEVAELTLIATTKVTGKVLEDADHKRLIDEAIRDLDFSVLEQEA